MSTVSLESLKNLPEVRELLDAVRAVTGVSFELNSVTTPALHHRTRHNEHRLAVPVVVSGQHVATFVSEPLAIEALNEPLVPDGNGQTIPAKLSDKQRQGLDRLLTIFSQQLARSINSHLIPSHDGEPSCVSQAKKFIQGHAHVRIGASDVAKHVHLSVDHFRRVFGRTTGLTFTEYLVRVRLEKAKELVANPKARLSEAALEAGFQSIPHFNRVFKAHVGMSPTAYRASLQGSNVSSTVLGKRKPPGE